MFFMQGDIGVPCRFARRLEASEDRYSRNRDQRSERIYGLRSDTSFSSGATSIFWVTRVRLALSGLPANAHMIMPIASVAALITPMSRFIAISRFASGMHKPSQPLVVEVWLRGKSPARSNDKSVQLRF
jgi:hypothetical protein